MEGVGAHKLPRQLYLFRVAFRGFNFGCRELGTRLLSQGVLTHGSFGKYEVSEGRDDIETNDAIDGLALTLASHHRCFRVSPQSARLQASHAVCSRKLTASCLGAGGLMTAA
ncbi:hypothetical protein IG631_23002 [Alternaria alternata]|nr:hypothetical protein IG631_23002 [Alternaria alternata]